MTNQYGGVMEAVDILDLKSSVRMDVQGQSLSPLPGDSDLLHFGNDRINVSRKVWVISPKRIKLACDSLKTR